MLWHLCRGHNSDSTHRTGHRFILRTLQNLRKYRTAVSQTLLFTVTALAKELQVFWGTSGIGPPLCELSCQKRQEWKSLWVTLATAKIPPKGTGACAEQGRSVCKRCAAGAHPHSWSTSQNLSKQELQGWALLGAAPGAQEEEEEEEGRAHC